MLVLMCFFWFNVSINVKLKMSESWRNKIKCVTFTVIKQLSILYLPYAKTFTQVVGIFNSRHKGREVSTV